MFVTVDLFMAHRAIPMIAFHCLESIIICIYILVTVLCHVCVVYIVKMLHHSGGSVNA